MIRRVNVLTHFVTYMFSACFCCLQFDKANKSVISAFIASYNENTVYYIAWVVKDMEIQRDNWMLTVVSFIKG